MRCLTLKLFVLFLVIYVHRNDLSLKTVKSKQYQTITVTNYACVQYGNHPNHPRVASLTHVVLYVEKGVN